MTNKKLKLFNNPSLNNITYFIDSIKNTVKIQNIWKQTLQKREKSLKEVN